MNDGVGQGVQMGVAVAEVFVMIIEKSGPEISGWPGLLPAGGEAGVEDFGLVGCHPGERVIFAEEDGPV